MELKEKVIVITGASHGLGAELARSFAKRGAKLIISARNKSELDKTASELKALAVVADVTKEEDIKKLAETTKTKFGKIDLWVNNAGIWTARQEVERISLKIIREIIDVNLIGTIIGCREALKVMKAQKHGVIVNIVSVSALAGRKNEAVYSASKFGADGFTKSIRLEAIDFGVKVYGVYPGGMKTQIFNADKPESYPNFMDSTQVAEQILQNLEKEQPEEELILRRLEFANQT